MYEVDSSIILNKMLKSLPSDTNTTEGSFNHDVLSPVSQELATSNIHLNEVLNKVFAQSAAENGYSAELELKCGEFGVIRKKGTKATGKVVFSGAESTLIPMGTSVQSSGGLQYITTSEVAILNGIALVKIEAVEINSIYNIGTNIVTQIPTTISGIISVTNNDIISGGTDAETDSALLARLLAQVQNPATSGNIAHYIQWGMQVNGIGLVQVFPLWNGNGTVKICAVDSNMQPLSNDLLTALSNYIEVQRPIGATVTYKSAIALPVDISVNVIKNTAYTQAQIQASLKISIIAYLKSIAFKQNYVSYAVVGSLILATPGVDDYNTLTVNGGTVNVSIGTEQVATQGTIIVNAP